MKNINNDGKWSGIDWTHNRKCRDMNEQLNTGGIAIYQTDDGRTSLEVNLVEDTVWLNLNQMAVLFDRDKSVTSRYIRNIFKESELEKRSTVAKFATTASDVKTYQSHQ